MKLERLDIVNNGLANDITWLLERVENSMAPFGRDCVEGRDDVAKDKTPRSSHTLQPLPHRQRQDHRCLHQERWGIAAYLTRQ